MKKKSKSQQSQPDNSSPPESASLSSKYRTPRKNTAESPRFKQSAEPTGANTCQSRSSTRLKESAKPTSQTPWHRQPGTAILTSLSRKTLASKRTTVLTSIKSKKDAGNSKEGRKKVKRNLDTSTGPCRGVQLRNPNDNLSDFEEEEEDEILQPNKDVQEEELDVDSDEDKVVEPTKKRKFVPCRPTQMHALKLGNTNPKSKVLFDFKEQTVGDPSMHLASCLGVLVLQNILLTFKDWRVVPHEAKANIWKIVEQRFIVPELFQDYYFAKMGDISKKLDLGKPVWYSRLTRGRKREKDCKANAHKHDCQLVENVCETCKLS